MYSTNTASGPKAVLQALATFATSAGFTVDYNNTYTGVGWWLAVHKGTCYLNFVADTADTQVTMYGATGYSSGSSYSAQAGTSGGVICNCKAGPYTGYHLFSTTGSAAYLHVAIEISAGIFSHFHAGALNSVGGATPCIYVQATNWNWTGNFPSYPDGSGGNYPWSAQLQNGQVGVNIDGGMKWFWPGRTGNLSANLPMQNAGFHANNLWDSPNTFNGLPILLPIPAFVQRTTGLYTYAGDAPDLRLINIKNNSPKDEITIGSDVWKVFPAIAKNPNTNVFGSPNPSSANYGYAFKKNA